MAEIVIMGAGLAGAIMAYEMKDQMRPEDRLTVVTKDPDLSFRAVEPLGRGRLAQARGHRGRSGPTMAKRASPSSRRRSPRSCPRRTGSNWRTAALRYDYLGHRHRSRTGLRRDRGPRPRRRFTASICHVDHAQKAGGQLRGILQKARPDRHRRGAGRVLLRPGLRVHVHPRHRAAPPQDPRPGADDLRHLRALYRPSRPRRRRRHQGPARKRDARAAHQVDHQRAHQEGRSRQDDGRGDRRRRLGQGDAGAAVRLFDDAAGLPRHRAVRGIEGLVNPRGFVIVDKHQQNPTYPEHLLRSASASPSRRSGRRRCRAACRRPAS